MCTSLLTRRITKRILDVSEREASLNDILQQLADSKRCVFGAGVWITSVCRPDEITRLKVVPALSKRKVKMTDFSKLVKDFGLAQLRVADIMDDKLIIDRKTLTTYPLSEEEIDYAEAGVICTNPKEECEICQITL